jgi:hypothetical protein
VRVGAEARAGARNGGPVATRVLVLPCNGNALRRWRSGPAYPAQDGSDGPSVGAECTSREAVDGLGVPC